MKLEKTITRDDCLSALNTLNQFVEDLKCDYILSPTLSQTLKNLIDLFKKQFESEFLNPNALDHSHKHLEVLNQHLPNALFRTNKALKTNAIDALKYVKSDDELLKNALDTNITSACFDAAAHMSEVPLIAGALFLAGVVSGVATYKNYRSPIEKQFIELNKQLNHDGALKEKPKIEMEYVSLSP